MAATENARPSTDRVAANHVDGKTLHFDFTQAATRERIIETLNAHLGATEGARIAQSAAASGIGDGHHHSLADVEDAIWQANVSDRVKSDALSIYRILAEAEADAHGCAIEETHFHEVGNGDRIRNTLAICMGIEAINPDAITATCIQVGSGKVRCAHGMLDVPAPATAAIIKRGIPVCSKRLPGELCTPTSAAIICHFVDRFIEAPGNQ